MGRIITSGTVVYGREGTKLMLELDPGDLIIVQHPTRFALPCFPPPHSAVHVNGAQTAHTSLKEEMRVVASVLSDVSMTIR